MTKTIVFSETIFCDTEKDDSILELYFERLKLSLLSISRQNIDGFDYHHCIYVSSDKKKYLALIEEWLTQNEIKRVSTVIYEHPDSGYGQNAEDHIDRIKNPNRSEKGRNYLFSLVDIDFSGYENYIRISIDDDDCWLSNHLKNIVDFSLFHNECFNREEIYAFSVLDSYVASSSQNVELTKLRFDRGVAGNKFLLMENEIDFKKWSPWSIPEPFSVEVINKFRNNYGIILKNIANFTPGFVYFRRGVNLSSQNKAWCTTNTFSTEWLKDEKSVLLTSNRADNTPWELTNSSGSIDITLNANKTSLIASFKGNNDKKYAFYLYGDKGLIEKTVYKNQNFSEFSVDGISDFYTVVCFIKTTSHVLRIKSKKIFIAR